MQISRSLVAPLALALLLVGLPASASDRGSIGTISPENRALETTSPPLVGIYPGQGLPAQPFALFRPTICETGTYCDAHELTVEYPRSYLREVFFGIVITLTWENPRTEDNPTGNDLDLFVFQDDGDPLLGFPINSDCQTPEDAPCNNLPSEQVTITEPQSTGGPDDGPPYRLTVVNHAGVNLGYAITVEWFTFELADPPDFERPGSDGPSTPEPVARPVVSGPVAAPTPGPASTPRTIVVPGPDGEPIEVELPALAAGQRLATDVESGTSPWIGAAVAGVLVFVVMGFGVLSRLRRESDDG